MSVRFAVLEAVTAGLCGAAPEPSLLAEGRAMWSAVVMDLARLADSTILSVLEANLAAGPFPSRVEILFADGDAHHRWHRLCETAVVGIIIAPETDGVLADLIAAAQRPGLQLWNATPATIQLATDKLRLAEHLLARSIPTLPTVIETWSDPPTAPCVIKPHDGAGSWLVRRVDDELGWQRVHNEYTATQSIPLRQPYVRGRALSIAGWFGPPGVDWLPVAEQRLSDDGTFRYLGGRIPAAITADEAVVVRAMVAKAAATLPGLAGYIGFDVLLPASAPGEPLLVEINPRFTTSYVGYRRWAEVNLLERWLRGTNSSALETGRTVVFDADGRITEESER